ncbi:Serine/threonine-protein kinase rio2-like protein [Drosera capensis]
MRWSEYLRCKTRENIGRVQPHDILVVIINVQNPKSPPPRTPPNHHPLGSQSHQTLAGNLSSNCGAWKNRAHMKLNVDVLRYLSSDDFRVLTAVELGMRNHEIVPVELVDRIAVLRYGGTYKVLKNLLRHKLLHHDCTKYDGYRLTYLGYDFLAIKTLVNRGVITGVGRQIGVGKESDIFEVEKREEEVSKIMVMKLHRLGRVSFRAVKSKRDYLRHRSSYNWLYLSRLAALKEFTFMKALKDHGFPAPSAIDCNRHCVIMDLVPGYPLVQVKQLQNPEVVFETIIGLIVRLAEHGLIHCDFNEFNIMIDDDENVTMIDFPQMVSVNHKNAQAFNLRFEQHRVEHDGTDSNNDENVDGRPCLSSISVEVVNLDKELAASGFTKKDQDVIDRFIEAEAEGSGDDSDPGSDDEVTTDEQNSIEELKETDTQRFDSCSLQVQDEEGLPSEAHQVPAPSSSGVTDAQDDDDNDQDVQPDSAPNEVVESEPHDTHDNGEGGEKKVDDAKLGQRLNKQRRRAVASAHGGRHRSFSSRNSYKDKGGKSSQNSKLKKQMSAW